MVDVITLNCQFLHEIQNMNTERRRKKTRERDSENKNLHSKQ